MPPRTPYEAELRERLETAEWQARVYHQIAALQQAVVEASRAALAASLDGDAGLRGERDAVLQAALDRHDRESGKIVLDAMPKQIREALAAPSAFEEVLKAQKEPLFPGILESKLPAPGTKAFFQVPAGPNTDALPWGPLWPAPEVSEPRISVIRTLQALVDLAWRHRDEPRYRELAWSLTEKQPTRQAKMEEIIDELDRRFVYAANPVKEVIGPVPFEPGAPVDADEACLFVMTLAMSIKIPCRIVGARYGKLRWTCFVSYLDDDTWNNVNPLRQRTDQVPNELVVFEPKPDGG